MKMESLKENFESLWDNISEGWRHLRASAAGALTRFKPGEKTDLPAPAEFDDNLYQTGRGWAMLSGDVFEDQGQYRVGPFWFGESAAKIRSQSVN